MTTTRLQPGWAWCFGAKRAHYFKENQTSSACGQWDDHGSFRVPTSSTVYQHSPGRCAQCAKVAARD